VRRSRGIIDRCQASANLGRRGEERQSQEEAQFRPLVIRRPFCVHQEPGAAFLPRKDSVIEALGHRESRIIHVEGRHAGASLTQCLGHHVVEEGALAHSADAMDADGEDRSCTAIKGVEVSQAERRAALFCRVQPDEL
jgi:hypothetical protein